MAFRRAAWLRFLGPAYPYFWKLGLPKAGHFRATSRRKDRLIALLTGIYEALTSPLPLLQTRLIAGALQLRQRDRPSS